MYIRIALGRKEHSRHDGIVGEKNFRNGPDLDYA